MFYSFKERPPEFFLCDEFHQLKQNLVFAGLGRFTGSTLFYDSSLYRNDGTLTNMDAATDWILSNIVNRYVLDLDGSDDYVQLSAMPGADDYTIAGWFNLRSFVTAGIIFCGTANLANALWVQSFSGTDRFWFGNGAVGYTTYTSTTVPTGFAHIAVAVTAHASSASAELFVNGVSQGLGNSSTIPADGNLSAPRIGRASGVSTYYYSMQCADVMVYRGKKIASEISALADPSNVMLSLGAGDQGLLRYRRQWWPVGTAAAPPAGNRRRRVLASWRR